MTIDPDVYALALASYIPCHASDCGENKHDISVSAASTCWSPHHTCINAFIRFTHIMWVRLDAVCLSGVCASVLSVSANNGSHGAASLRLEPTVRAGCWALCFKAHAVAVSAVQACCIS
jgi:hypothetical protein